jgi:hypothetical protein
MQKVTRFCRISGITGMACWNSRNGYHAGLEPAFCTPFGARAFLKITWPFGARIFVVLARLQRRRMFENPVTELKRRQNTKKPLPFFFPRMATVFF